MNVKTEAVRLASGKVLRQGQTIRLVDKISLMFPSLKGNMLPVKNFQFCEDKSHDFRFVELLLSQDEGIKAHKTLSLMEDELVGFSEEDGVWYGYTTYFKIALSQALQFGEFIIAPERLIPAKEKAQVRVLITALNDNTANYCFGLLTEQELESRVVYEHIYFLRARKRWDFKDARFGFIGGTAPSLLDF